MDHSHDPDIAGKIGVWVSGFFGSGKSHFIKVLSSLLGNKTHTHNSRTRRAVEKEKGSDPFSHVGAAPGKRSWLLRPTRS